MLFLFSSLSSALTKGPDLQAGNNTFQFLCLSSSSISLLSGFPSVPNTSRDSLVMVDEPELTHRAPLAPCGPVIKPAPISPCLTPTYTHHSQLSLALLSLTLPSDLILYFSVRPLLP